MACPYPGSCIITGQQPGVFWGRKQFLETLEKYSAFFAVEKLTVIQRTPDSLYLCLKLRLIAKWISFFVFLKGRFKMFVDYPQFFCPVKMIQGTFVISKVKIKNGQR